MVVMGWIEGWRDGWWWWIWRVGSGWWVVRAGAERGFLRSGRPGKDAVADDWGRSGEGVDAYAAPEAPDHRRPKRA